jgi:hypothetical protein
MSPEARRAAVVPLIAQGCTAAGIATKLGASRSAVIGFCSRQGLTLPGKSGGRVNLSRPKNERSAAGGHATRKKAGVTLANHAARPSVAGGADFAAAIAVVAAAPVDALAPPPAGGVGFFALTDRHCRRPLWPDGPPPALAEMVFCGARAVVGGAYCPACAPRLTAPTPGLIRQRNRTYGAAAEAGAS